MTNAILDQARHLTSSEHGYVSLIDPETGNNVVYTFMQMMQEGQCDISSGEQKIVFPIGSDGRYPGLWGHALNTKEAFFTNAPADHPSSIGVPKGHVPLGRFLSVPTLIGEELVGQIALANSDRRYTDQDLNAIQRLAEFYALAIVRMRMEWGLQKAHDELEEKVIERTRELQNEIEERKEAEAQLDMRASMLAAIFNSSVDHMYILDKDIRLLYTSKSAADALGLTTEQMIGKTLRDFGAPPDRIEPVDVNFRKALTTGMATRGEIRYPGVSGIREYEYIMAPIPGAEGNTELILGMVRDITERK